MEPNRFTDKALSDMTTVWDSIGPDAVPGWFTGGEERIGKRIAEAIKTGDELELGSILMKLAVPYIEGWVETLTEAYEEQQKALEIFNSSHEVTPLDISRREDARAINSDLAEKIIRKCSNE